MEDGLFQSQSDFELQDTIKNGIVSIMPCFPDDKNAVLHEDGTESYKEAKFNGNVNVDSNIFENEYSSESDALVIDESNVKKSNPKRKRLARGKQHKKYVREKETEIITHSNPFFNESLYELSRQHHTTQLKSNIVIRKDDEISSNCKKHRKGRSKSPKREYAQYLGLQPTVQFKCSKCSQSGFETLTALNDHIIHCDAVCTVKSSPQEHSSSSFKLTRKVFLCSACGTYYENWNLYLHMLELHRRFICLYCLGMFSAPNDLCHHIQTRHNLQPGHKNSLDEFFNVYNDPCYVVCCECNKLFSEEDNFFYHSCIKSTQSKNNIFNQKPISKNKASKVQIRPEHHVTGDSGAVAIFQKQFDQQPAIEKNMQNKMSPSEDDNSGKNLPNINQMVLNPEGKISQEGIGKQNDAESVFVAMDNHSNIINNSLFDVESDSVAGNESYIGLEENVLDSQENEILCGGSLSNFTSPNLNKSGGALDVASEESSSLMNQDSSSMTANINSEAEGYAVTNFDDVHPLQDTEHFDEMNQINDTIENYEMLSSRIEVVQRTLPGEQNSLGRDADNFTEQSEKTEGNCHEDNIFKSIGTNICESFETRKVPKLSLKLRKVQPLQDIYDDSDDCEKPNLESGYTENEFGHIYSEAEMHIGNIQVKDNDCNLHVAGPDVNIVELQLEQPLDKFEIKILLQKCLRATVPNCIYCNHARKIAVNGKQLALHAIAEHRYAAVVNSITAEELTPETFVVHIKESLIKLENVFFNLESGATHEGVMFSHVFECFQCRYSTTVHKELYLHNRKLHTKNLLLCIMCKSNFYSYSELICHLCPGLYVLDYDIQFRCCMCDGDDLPSAFRLMVHLRKRHNVCDVCLEMCTNQYKLSNHVWKHKLHHFCYRCGIAYRNKPDITRHLFWKHGTESVLCKKCLQKKWPHVYHFCVPPTTFLCDECNLMFTRAVSLKVHKRIHTNDEPHHCTIDDCKESFISKKLLLKHELKHREPVEHMNCEAEKICLEPKSMDDGYVEEEVVNIDGQGTLEKNEQKTKSKLDMYGLPVLNLSESDSESEAEMHNEQNNYQFGNLNQTDTKKINDLNILVNLRENKHDDDGNENNISMSDTANNGQLEFDILDKVPLVLENIWDNFKNYQAEKEKNDNLLTDKDKLDEMRNETVQSLRYTPAVDLSLVDHDYCFNSESKVDTFITEMKPDLTQAVDHDYCSPRSHSPASPIKMESGKNRSFQEITADVDKHTQSTSCDSSSGSDSSSCTCGSNCSCSSSSPSSSSSSDTSDSDSSTEEGRKKQQLKHELHKENSRNRKNVMLNSSEITKNESSPVISEMPVQESDLDTTESETDEEFYDKQPQKLSKKFLEEKRIQLLEEMGPIVNDACLDINRSSTTNFAKETKLKKKLKSKKKKKHKIEKKEQGKGSCLSSNISESTYYQCYQQSQSTIAPITLTISRNSPISSQSTPTTQSTIYSKFSESSVSRIDDLNLRASKRRRVPNKFYGYSSDEDEEKNTAHISKWRKTELQPLQQQPMTVPPITIKTTQTNLPTVIEPLTLRPVVQAGELPILPRLSTTLVRMPPRSLSSTMTTEHHLEDSASDSNDSSSEEIHKRTDKPSQPQLYCYCRCPYDEVSEMIGCDASDCAIEWFHFECVGIMVPPKGQWFCPDCRKKKQLRREAIQI